MRRVAQSAGVLLGGDDGLWFGHPVEGVLYELQVLGAEVVVVGECQGGDMPGVSPHVLLHLQGIAYAREQQHVHACGLQLVEPERAGVVDMHGLSVAYGAVEQTLEGLQPECRA